MNDGRRGDGFFLDFSPSSRYTSILGFQEQQAFEPCSTFFYYPEFPYQNIGLCDYSNYIYE